MNTPEPLLYYQMGRGYPVADDRLFNLVAKYYGGSSMTILASGHGLLGQRIIDFLGIPTTAIEADEDLIRDSKLHGVKMYTHHLDLTDDSLVLFKRLIDMHMVDVLLGQNCLLDIAMGDALRWDSFMQAIDASQIYEIFFEDKKPGEVIAKLEALFHVAVRDEKCVYMVRNRKQSPKRKPPA
jgi:hypothetical protein